MGGLPGQRVLQHPVCLQEKRDEDQSAAQGEGSALRMLAVVAQKIALRHVGGEAHGIPAPARIGRLR